MPQTRSLTWKTGLLFFSLLTFAFGTLYSVHHLFFTHSALEMLSKQALEQIQQSENQLQRVVQKATRLHQVLHQNRLLNQLTPKESAEQELQSLLLTLVDSNPR
ncbi:MAG: hypothetical protein EOM23_03045, partial [Candidatus Moranbacteria bacterium]|nr:hypothetical protein [Candidatus Moranbacteria bacterium]